MTPTELRRRLAALERRPAAACGDPWHAWSAPRAIDYRHSIVALAPPGTQDVPQRPLAQTWAKCPSCGATRPTVDVRALPLEPYLVEWYAQEAAARRLLQSTEPTEGVPADDHD